MYTGMAILAFNKNGSQYIGVCLTLSGCVCPIIGFITYMGVAKRIKDKVSSHSRRTETRAETRRRMERMSRDGHLLPTMINHH
jgi:hypothetical protein